MIVFLYSEFEGGDVEGPFSSLLQAVDSVLWEKVGVCLWIEHYEGGCGWVHENVKWCGDHWFVTSFGLTPIPPFRPHFIERACVDLLAV